MWKNKTCVDNPNPHTLWAFVNVIISHWNSIQLNRLMGLGANQETAHKGHKPDCRDPDELCSSSSAC